MTKQITLKILEKLRENYILNIKQCEVYENRFLHVPTNCVRNIVGKSTVTQCLDKRTRNLQQPHGKQAICYVIRTITMVLTYRYIGRDERIDLCVQHNKPQGPLTSTVTTGNSKTGMLYT